MLPHLEGRPLNLERYPDGIAGERIVQQRAGRHFPNWIPRAEVPAQKGAVEHVVASEPAVLVYLAGQACITPHPWLSRRDRLERPDRLIFDLDPSRNDEPDAVRRGACRIRDLLRELGLGVWVMTSGSRGYHVVVPLQRRAEFDEVREFARDVAVVAAARDPQLFTNEQRKAKRDGRILIDVMRNAYGHTSVAPYAVRARPGAPVATPLDDGELSDRGTRPDRWTLATIPERIERDGDPWREIGRRAHALSGARGRLRDVLAELQRAHCRGF
jgi:bifunctional non-homologous end joining protein LigD